MWAIYAVVTKIIRRFFKIGTKFGDPKKSITIMKLINNILKYVIIIIAILMILNQFGFDTKGLIASLGIAGVIAGLALKDLLADFIAGIAIVTENQFEVGDFVTIGGFTGSVVELGMQSTKIKSLTGEVKIISNGNITEVINHSKFPNTVFIDIPVSYESDLNKVEKVLKDVCEEINKTVVYLTSDLEILGIESLGDDSIIYRLSANVGPMQGPIFKRTVYKSVKEYFDKNNITIPYKQLVVHNE
jgi:small conductance mechanosensitive channel